MIVSCTEEVLVVPAAAVDAIRDSFPAFFLNLRNGYLELCSYEVIVQKERGACRIQVSPREIGAGDVLYRRFVKEQPDLAQEMLIQRLQKENSDLSRKQATEKANTIIKRVLS